MFEIDEGAEKPFDLEVTPDTAALLEIAVIILGAAAPAFAQPQFGAQPQFTAERGIGVADDRQIFEAGPQIGVAHIAEAGIILVMVDRAEGGLGCLGPLAGL